MAWTKQDSCFPRVDRSLQSSHYFSAFCRRAQSTRWAPSANHARQDWDAKKMTRVPRSPLGRLRSLESAKKMRLFCRLCRSVKIWCFSRLAWWQTRLKKLSRMSSVMWEHWYRESSQALEGYWCMACRSCRTLKILAWLHCRGPLRGFCVRLFPLLSFRKSTDLFRFCCSLFPEITETPLLFPCSQLSFASFLFVPLFPISLLPCSLVPWNPRKPHRV